MLGVCGDERAAGIDDIGIGPGTSGANPDWTFLANAQTWNVKRLFVLVRPVAPAPLANPGWRLEGQTNSLSTGLGTNWATVPGSTLTNQVFIPVGGNPANVFYRLVYP